MVKVRTYEEAKNKYFLKIESEDYSIIKFRKLIDFIGYPLSGIKVIHVAWTNWKGSVSKMLFSILKEAWYKVWVYTQPSLYDFRDRFETTDWIISKRDCVRLLNYILELPYELAFFEISTLIAFLYFKEKKVDFAIIEVGIWWLYDSTNVVKPFITAITSIWFDHMELLWSTIEEISFKKAGIIKNWIPIVYNHENKIIEKTAKEKNAPIIYASGEKDTNMHWNFQRKNAAIAYEICKYIWIEDSIISKWLMSVTHRWRLEYVSENLLIDWAHNEDWLKELKKYLDEVSNKYDKIIYVFSLKKSKDVKLVLDVFWCDKEYIIFDL